MALSKSNEPRGYLRAARRQRNTGASPSGLYALVEHCGKGFGLRGTVRENSRDRPGNSNNKPSVRTVASGRDRHVLFSL